MFNMPCGVQKWYRGTELNVCVSEGPLPHGMTRHVSVSLHNRLPSWEDLRAIKDAFFGEDVDVMQVLPRKEAYYNCCEFCLHLWDIPEKWSITEV